MAFFVVNGGAKSAALGGHRYHWKGTSYGTYQTTTPWVNVATSAGLVDWTDVEAAWLLLAQMVDPYTGSTAGTVRVVALQDTDIALRNVESFATMVDALTA